MRKLLLFVVFVTLVIIDLATGSVWISFSDLIDILSFNADESTLDYIVWGIRIPKILTAVAAGTSLSLCGLIMQSIFRNPLAGPFVLGVSSGASLGVAVVLMSGVTLAVSTVFGGMVGAFSILIIVAFLGNKFRSTSLVLIIGLMMSYFSSAVTSYLISISNPEQIQQFSLWGLGSFSKVEYSELGIMYLSLSVCFVLFYLNSKKLNIYIIGDEYAAGVGVDARSLKYLMIILVGVLGGLVTSFCGPIAFVGVAVPHLARLILKSGGHQSLLTGTLIIGSIFILLADILSEMPFWNNALPINSVTCIIGAPIMLSVVIRMRKSNYQL